MTMDRHRFGLRLSSLIAILCVAALLCADVAPLVLVTTADAQGRGGRGGRGGRNQNPVAGQSRGQDFYNLGPIGAMGMPDAEGIAVKVVDTGSRAESAGLRSGSRIIGVGGHKFAAGEDFINIYGQAFDKAEEKDGKLVLDLAGGREVTITLKKTGEHSNRGPGKKSDEALRAACEFLVKNQRGDGSFKSELGGVNGTCVVTSLAGLALLSTGQRGYMPAVNRAAAYVMKNAGVDTMGNPTWDQTNWGLGYGGWFIAAYYDVSKDAQAKTAMQRIVDTLASNMVKGTERGAYNKGGGWAHGPARNGPNALNYLELEIMSNYALATLGMADSMGCTVDKAVIRRAQSYIADCTVGTGGVAYSTRRGQFPGTAEPGRTSGALFAMLSSKGDSGLTGRMANYVKTQVDRIPFGHGSPCLHMLAGAVGTNAAGRQYFQTFWQRWRIRLMICRHADGSFSSWPTRETQQIGNTDIKVGPLWSTANLALILGLQKGHLPTMQGKPGRATSRPDAEPDTVPDPEPVDGAEATNNDGGGDTGDPSGPAATPEPEPEPEIVWPKDTPGYATYMKLLGQIIPPGHRALKAESVTESMGMLNDQYKANLHRFAEGMVSRARGDERNLLKKIRDMTE